VEPNSRGTGAFRHDRYVQFEASAAPGRVRVEAASKGTPAVRSDGLPAPKAIAHA
jgi:hypothetical protein